VTVSTSRYGKSPGEVRDESGDIAEKIIEGRGHSVEKRSLVPDDPKLLKSSLRRFFESKADVLVFTGGTGLSRTDVTIETVRPYFEKEIEGFGELIRGKGFEEIGAAAVLSRATAGVARGKLVICLPGSPRAVETGLKLFISELPHAIHVARG